MAGPSAWTVEVGEAEFEREVLKRSEETPVLVDFWAPWCAPCHALGPILERLATEHEGAFVLARVNVDEAPRLAEVFGVRSIPAVKGFRDGRLVSEFVGAQPEPVVRQVLATLLPTEADRLAREAASLAAAGKRAEAETRFREALGLDARLPRALLGLARLLAERGETTEALSLLERVPPGSPVEAETERLAAELRTRTHEAGDEDALRSRFARDSEDLDARLELGQMLAARGRYEEALGELLAVVRRDPGLADEAARKAMVDIFSVLGPDHPLTARFRRELAKALFR